MVKPRENRVPIMMSDKELQDVDDWRFNNRVATRSDAIRKLMKIALTTDDWIVDAEKYAEDALDKFVYNLAKIGDLSDDFIAPIGEVYNALILLYVEVMKVTRAAHAVRQNDDISEAIADADYYRSIAIEEKVKLFETKFGIERKD